MREKRARSGLLPPDNHLGWTPYGWLLFLPIFLIEPVVRAYLGTLATGQAALTGIALIIFLASYFRGYWAEESELLLIVIFQTLLGISFAPINHGAPVFFVYAASFAGTIERTRIATISIILIAVSGAITSWYTTAPLTYWIPTIGLPLLIGFVNLQSAQAKRADARLRLAHDQIEQLATVAERERIARDLHDLLGHTLTLIVLKAELAAKLTTRDPERAAQEIRDVEVVSRTALQEVREAIHGYRASLAEEIEQSDTILNAAGISVRFHGEQPALKRTVEESVALALREAVTNVVRHSGARNCEITLHIEDGHCILRVEDDGRGATGTEGSGLRGMRERIESIGGSVDRELGNKGRGHRILARVPIT